MMGDVERAFGYAFACVQWTAAVSFSHNLVMGGSHVSKGEGGCIVVVVGRPGYAICMH